MLLSAFLSRKFTAAPCTRKYSLLSQGVEFWFGEQQEWQRSLLYENPQRLHLHRVRRPSRLQDSLLIFRAFRPFVIGAIFRRCVSLRRTNCQSLRPVDAEYDSAWTVQDVSDIDKVLESIQAPRFIDFLSEVASRDDEAKEAWRLSMGDGQCGPTAGLKSNLAQVCDDDDFRKRFACHIVHHTFYNPFWKRMHLCCPRTYTCSARRIQ